MKNNIALFKTSSNALQSRSIGQFLGLIFILISINLTTGYAQKTWVGTTADWNTASNWNPNGVPTVTDDVIIPNVGMSPIINGTTTAFAKFVFLHFGTTMTLDPMSSLTISGSGSHGMEVEGLVTNYGNIQIDNTVWSGILNRQTGTFDNFANISIGTNGGSIGVHGLDNQGIFNNSALGVINLANTDGARLENFGSVAIFNNAGNITMDGTTGWVAISNEREATFNNDNGGNIEIINSGNDGILNHNDGFFNNNSGGNIEITSATNDGLRNPVGIFNNAGTISVGTNGFIGRDGINNSSTFNHLAGTIMVDNTNNTGIANRGPFENHASIIIGSVGPIGDQGLLNFGTTFNNNLGGNIQIDNVGVDGLNNSSATFENNGNITVGTNGFIGRDGINTTGTFNHLAGTIMVDNTNNTAIANRGLFENHASIIIGSVGSIGDSGIFNDLNNFNNHPNGSILINNARWGISIFPSGSFTNNAEISIELDASVSIHGIWNRNLFTNQTGVINISGAGQDGIYNLGTVNNLSTILIGSNGMLGRDGIRNEGNLNNLTGGSLVIDDLTNSGIANLGGRVQNDGNILIGSNNIVNEGGIFSNSFFENNGTIEIVETGLEGIATTVGTFDNNGNITIGRNGMIGRFGLSIFGDGIFNNNIGGDLKIDNTIGQGIINNSRGIINNYASIDIGTVGTIGNQAIIIFQTSTLNNHTGGTIQTNSNNVVNPNFDGGIWIQGVFNNHGLATTSGRIINFMEINNFGILNSTYTDGIGLGNYVSGGLLGVITNASCAEINVNGSLQNRNIITNDGYISFNTNLEHQNTGTITNNGVINYFQGNPIPEVINNNALAIEAVPITGNCQKYTPAFSLGILGNTIEGFYVDEAATVSAGTYDLTTNTFTADPVFTTGLNNVFVKLISDNCSPILPITFIAIEDTTPPVAPTPPADITVQCSGDIPTVVALTAMDDYAGPITVFPTFEITNQICASRFTQTYTWIFDDGCGNTSAISQSIQVIDTEALVINSSPVNQVVDCEVNVIAQEHLVEVISSCGNQPTITSSISDPIGTLGCNGTQYIITYTAADDCGRLATATQTYTIQNEGPEVLTGNEVCYLPCSVGGDELLALFNDFAEIAVVLDACVEGVSTVTNNFNPNGLGGCGSVQIVTFTATDACGRTGTSTVPVIVVDDVAPTVNGSITPGIRECDDLAGLQYLDWINQSITALDATDNCSDVSVSYQPLLPNTDFVEGFPFATTEVVFTISDDCGNDLLVAGIFNLKNNNPPTFIGELEDKMITCPALPEFDTPVYSHGCGDASLTFLDENNGGDCPSGYTVTRTWTVTDADGSTSTTQQTIFVMGSNNQMSTIAGLITTELDEPVEAVSIALNTEGSNFAQEDMTTDDGLYDFITPGNHNYEIQPIRNDDPLNGVTTYDLILLAQHLLNIQSLNSPYQMIAGDINNSGSITALDIIELRRLILGIDQELNNNTSWRFVDANYVFTNPTNPFTTTFPELVNINGLNGSLEQDFIGIKVGDLNGSAQPNALAIGDSRAAKSTQYLLATDGRMEKGETRTIEIKAKDFTSILGFQMTLEFDRNKMNIMEIIPGNLRGLTTQNFGFQNQKSGIITTSWNTTDGLNLKDETVLFSLVVQANQTLTLSEVISSSSKLISAEAYSEIHGVMHSQLSFESTNGLKKDGFALYQNYPNPFELNTTVGFYLDKAGETSFKVFDTNGYVRYIENGSYEKGYHEISLEAAELGEAGILYYQLNTADRKPQSKKMILIK